MLLRLALASLVWFVSAATVAIYAYGILRARSSLRSLARLGGEGLRRPVSVVVPARNEEARIGGLLDSLASADPHKVIVVDDGSTDGTAAKVMGYSGRLDVEVVRLAGTPRGWLPKPYALEVGASRVPLGDSALFLDADVRGDLGPVLAAASGVRPGELVAFEPRFVCRTKTCRVTQPLLSAIVHGFFGFNRALDRGDRHSMMYGCCWSIDPYSFWEEGGEAPVRSAIVEDRALAVRLKSRGFRLRPYDARDHLEVLSWDSARDFVNLVRRVSYGVSRSMGPASYAAFSAGVLLLFAWPLAAVPLLAAGAWWLSLGPIASYAAQASFAAVGQRAERIRGPWFLLSPIAGALAAYGFISSRWSAVSWRGRELRPEGRQPREAVINVTRGT